MAGPGFNEKEQRLVEIWELFCDVVKEQLSQKKANGEEEEPKRPAVSAAMLREVREFLRANRVDVAFCGRDLKTVGPRGVLRSAETIEEEEEPPFSDIG